MIGRLSRAVVEPATATIRITLYNEFDQQVATLTLAAAADTSRSDSLVMKLNLAREIARRINGNDHNG